MQVTTWDLACRVHWQLPVYFLYISQNCLVCVRGVYSVNMCAVSVSAWLSIKHVISHTHIVLWPFIETLCFYCSTRWRVPLSLCHMGPHLEPTVWTVNAPKCLGAVLVVDSLLHTNPLIKSAEQGPCIYIGVGGGGFLSENQCHLPAAAPFNHLWNTTDSSTRQTAVSVLLLLLEFFQA